MGRRFGVAGAVLALNPAGLAFGVRFLRATVRGRHCGAGFIFQVGGLKRDHFKQKGQSAVPSGSRHYRQLARELVHVLRDLGWSAALRVGHGMPLRNGKDMLQ
jgi:hypothetical protein